MTYADWYNIAIKPAFLDKFYRRAVRLVEHLKNVPDSWIERLQPVKARSDQGKGMF